VDIQGSVGPAGISRPKHKRTFTGFGAGEIKSVEGILHSPNVVEGEAPTIAPQLLELPRM
jgi:hypothetical protein